MLRKEVRKQGVRGIELGKANNELYIWFLTLSVEGGKKNDEFK